MQDQMESGDDYETVACRWLRAHGDLWKAWIPDETECFPGFGLFDSLLGTYVDNRQDPLHKTCNSKGFWKFHIGFMKAVQRSLWGPMGPYRILISYIRQSRSVKFPCQGRLRSSMCFRDLLVEVGRFHGRHLHLCGMPRGLQPAIGRILILRPDQEPPQCFLRRSMP